jgi:hypothetical protein
MEQTNTVIDSESTAALYMSLAAIFIVNFAVLEV